MLDARDEISSAWVWAFVESIIAETRSNMSGVFVSSIHPRSVICAVVVYTTEQLERESVLLQPDFVSHCSAVWSCLQTSGKSCTSKQVGVERNCRILDCE